MTKDVFRNNKFWHYSQNNSGGYFIESDVNGVCSDIIIEAETASDANRKLYKMSVNTPEFFEYCECCGERWIVKDPVLDKGDDVPEMYGTPVSELVIFSSRNYCYIHRADGTIERVDFKKAEI